MQARARPHLMTLGYNIHGTGLTRVMQTVTRQLADRYRIDFLGIGDHTTIRAEGGVRHHPTNTRGGGDVFGAFQAVAMARDDPPDILFILHDIWMFEYYMRMFAPLRPRTRLVGYVPLDGNIPDPELARPLAALDLLIVYTDWAAGQVNAAFAALIAQGTLDRAPPVLVIPHGVDAATFAPAPDLVAAGFHDGGRQSAKRDVFGPADWVEDSFIILNAARPGARKRVDLTIEGFARFVRGKPPSVKLCLHHAIAEPETEGLLSLIDRFGIRDHILHNPLSPKGGPLSEGDLARLYRACDVGLNTAMGEGWGLVSFEHASTGAAQIVPDHTACAALWDTTTARMIPTSEWVIPGFSPLEMGLVTPETVAEALTDLHADPAYRARLAAAGHRFANRPDFAWPAIADRFDHAFRGVLPALARKPEKETTTCP